jgi:hypothetical protein
VGDAAPYLVMAAVCLATYVIARARVLEPVPEA